MARLSCCTALMLLLLASGCGDPGPKRYPVSGHVTYVAPPPLVPSKCARPDNSGFVVEVRPDQENEIDINLQ